MDFTVEFNEEQFEKIETILEEDLIGLGVSCVLLIDLAGNILISLDDGKTEHDVYSLAALAAGNFGAVSEMAKLIGEEDFSLLFHKGETESLHFAKVSDELLLISIFGKDVSLGFLRLKINDVIQRVTQLI